MDSSLSSPVEALNRTFELPEQLPENADSLNQAESFHGVVVGDLGLLLASDKVVVEIFETLPLCPLPNTPPWLHAMANQRGNIIPVFDLAILLGLPNSEPRRSYYLVIGQNENAFGMLLEQLPEKILLEPDDELKARPSIPGNLEPFVKRCFEKNQKIWLEWEPLAFLSHISTNE